MGDFAAGLSGDALDLVAEALYAGNKKRALDWARQWLGLTSDPAAAVQRAAPPQPRPAAMDDETARIGAAAWCIFAAATPAIGTPVELYLSGRGICLHELGRQPRALRYHPALFNRETGRQLPAMVAAVSGPNGKFCAVHRTWLQRGSGGWRKAPLDSPKMVLGRLGGGSVRLWRGASGKALAQAHDAESVVVAEGIETGLSVAVACPERRVIAAISVGNMGKLVLPPAIKLVTIAADNDAPDSPATRALQAAIDRFSAEGRRVLIARSPVGSDLNDALTSATTP